jgi:hypothetical protein
MIVVGTEIWNGGRARASKRVAMQACTVDRFPVPYRTGTVPYFHFDCYAVLDRTVP